jgi:hypothetical protein
LKHEKLSAISIQQSAKPKGCPQAADEKFEASASFNRSAES